MLVRLNETRWVNIDRVTEICIAHVKYPKSENTKFRVTISTEDNVFCSDNFSDKQDAIAFAAEIVRRFNKEEISCGD